MKKPTYQAGDLNVIKTPPPASTALALAAALRERGYRAVANSPWLGN
jgi:hypothetical protein